MRLAFDDEFQLAGQHVDDLFVGMLMLGERRARIDVHPRVRHAIGVHQAGAKTGKNLTNRKASKLNERHAPV